MNLSINVTSGGLTGCFQAVCIFVCGKKGQVVKGIPTWQDWVYNPKMISGFHVDLFWLCDQKLMKEMTEKCRFHSAEYKLKMYFYQL